MEKKTLNDVWIGNRRLLRRKLDLMGAATVLLDLTDQNKREIEFDRHQRRLVAVNNRISAHRVGGHHFKFQLIFPYFTLFCSSFSWFFKNSSRLLWISNGSWDSPWAAIDFLYRKMLFWFFNSATLKCCYGDLRLVIQDSSNLFFESVSVPSEIESLELSNLFRSILRWLLDIVDHKSRLMLKLDPSLWMYYIVGREWKGNSFGCLLIHLIVSFDLFYTALSPKNPARTGGILPR